MATCKFCAEILTQDQLEEFIAANENDLMNFCETYLAYDKQGKVRLYVYAYADDPFYNSYNEFKCNYCPHCGRKLN